MTKYTHGRPGDDGCDEFSASVHDDVWSVAALKSIWNKERFEKSKTTSCHQGML